VGATDHRNRGLIMAGFLRTKARVSLLRAVSRRDVTLYPAGDSYRDDVSPGRRCNEAMWDLERAGWVERPDSHEPEGEPWVLTDAGRQVLEAKGTTE
jgi:hypothetical protein